MIARMWLLVRRAFVFVPRLYNHQPTASALRICSSAPQVTNSATCSVRGPVSADTVFAKYRSAVVGRTLIGVMIFLVKGKSEQETVIRKPGSIGLLWEELLAELKGRRRIFSRCVENFPDWPSHGAV